MMRRTRSSAPSAQRSPSWWRCSCPAAQRSAATCVCSSAGSALCSPCAPCAPRPCSRCRYATAWCLTQQARQTTQGEFSTQSRCPEHCQRARSKCGSLQPLATVRAMSPEHLGAMTACIRTCAVRPLYMKRFRVHHVLGCSFDKPCRSRSTCQRPALNSPALRTLRFDSRPHSISENVIVT